MQPLYAFLEQAPLPNENLNPNIFEILRNEEVEEENMTFISDPRCEPNCEEYFEEEMFVEDEQESSFSTCVLQELKLDSRNNNQISQKQQQQQQLYGINMTRIFSENLEESLMAFPKHNNSQTTQQKENSKQKISSDQNNKTSVLINKKYVNLFNLRVVNTTKILPLQSFSLFKSVGKCLKKLGKGEGFGKVL